MNSPKLSAARRNTTKTSKLIDALQKDQMKRCSEMGQSSSSGLLNPVLLDGRSTKSLLSTTSEMAMGRFGGLAEEPQFKSAPLSPALQRSDSDENFLEGLQVLAPNSMDTLLELMNQSAGSFRVYLHSPKRTPQ